MLDIINKGRITIIYRQKDGIQGQFNNVVDYRINEKGRYINIYWNYQRTTKVFMTLNLDKYLNIDIYKGKQQVLEYKDKSLWNTTTIKI